MTLLQLLHALVFCPLSISIFYCSMNSMFHCFIRISFLLFLRISEYRVKCEEESNYLEAGRAHKQLGILRKQEEKRQQKAVRARQISERQDVQLAHNMQFSDFNAAWDSYMEGNI